MALRRRKVSREEWSERYWSNGEISMIAMSEELQPKSGDFTSVDAAVSQRSNPVQEHVDAIVDDLTAGRVSGGQRATLGRALQDAAIGSIGKRHE